jgi:hypothetical protein
MIIPAVIALLIYALQKVIFYRLQDQPYMGNRSSSERLG